MRTYAAVLLATLVALACVLLGLWWAPFAIGLVLGAAIPRPRAAIPWGAVVGLLSWLVPLAVAHSRYGLVPTAQALAAIMGFGHQAAVPLALTLVAGSILGLTGAWLGNAVRSVVAPSARVDASRNG